MAAQSIAWLLPLSPNRCCVAWLCATSSSTYPSSTCGARRKCAANARGWCDEAHRGKNEDLGLGRLPFGRRAVGILGLAVLGGTVWENDCAAVEFADMPALRGKDYGKTKMRYSDYTETESGLQYKDLRAGLGSVPQAGDVVVVDWDGYTIGYYGRIFEARNKAKGGSFEGTEKEFFKFRLGWNEVIPAFEEAVATMHVGGVRRILVPPELGYPDNDFGKKGPRPTTFSGQRALDFVLRNQGLIDKTLLFDIELLRISSQVTASTAASPSRTAFWG